MPARFDFYPVEHLAQDLQAGHPVLTPNDRLARRIRLSWAHSQADEGRQSWFTPRVMSLQHWWLEAYQNAVLGGSELAPLVTPEQELELWRSAVLEHSESGALLRPAGAARLARDARTSLLLWRQDIGDPAVAQQFGFSRDGRLFLDWARHVDSRLAELGLARLPELIPVLVDHTRCDRLVLAEFADLPPLHEELLERAAGECTHVTAPARTATCYLQAAESADDELAEAARWVADGYRDDPSQRIGLLVPGLEMQRASVERHLRTALDARLPDDPLPVNFSAGVPLATCGPVRTALALLGLLCRDTSLQELTQLLGSRYRDDGEREEEQALILRLYALGRESVSRERLRAQCARVGGEAGLRLGQQLVALASDRAFNRSKTASAWRAPLLEALESLGWPGNPSLTSIEYQQVEQFYGVLERLSLFDSVTNALSLDDALQRLERLCGEAVFQPKTADASIQVLGPLEAAGLQFDRLWICGMDSQQWPAAASPNPFIPVDLQVRLDMPHASADRELRIARELLDQYRRSSTTLIASYQSMADDAPQEPSPLAAQFVELPKIAAFPVPAAWSNAGASEELEWYQDIQALPLAPGEAEHLRGGSRILADQSQCPFRALAYHRLGAQPLSELASGLNAAERGALLHDALFQLWKGISGSDQLAALDESQRKAMVLAAVDAASEDFRVRDEAGLGRALLEIEKQRLEQRLLAWLDLETRREPFSVVALEQEAILTLGPLELRLRVDRVDEVADGSRFIIDYKSGRSEPRDWLGERPKEPQLPLYAEIVGDKLAGLAFAILHRSGLEFRGLSSMDVAPGVRTDLEKVLKRDSEGPQDWDALRMHWSRTLARLAEEFADGAAAVDPLDRGKTCTWCGLESLCRVQ